MCKIEENSSRQELEVNSMDVTRCKTASNYWLQYAGAVKIHLIVCKIRSMINSFIIRANNTHAIDF